MRVNYIISQALPDLQVRDGTGTPASFSHFFLAIPVPALYSGSKENRKEGIPVFVIFHDLPALALAAGQAQESALLGAVERVNSFLNNIVWGWPALILLAFVGVFLTVRTKFFQVSHIGHWMKETIGSIVQKDVLGIFYRRRNSAGEWSGGAMYYLRDGLGAKKGCKAIGLVLAGLFSVFCFLASFGIGNMTQINSISGNMRDVFGIPTWVTGIAVVILTGLVVLGGLKRIASVTEKLVPVMVILYMIGSIVIFFANITMIGPVFRAVFTRAFSMEAAAGGAAGTVIKLAIEQGMKRGVFSNEAGLGSSVMVHSSSNVKEPVRQGMWGIFEVFADTIVVCTLTAFSVLSSGLVDLETGVTQTAYKGVELSKANLVSTAFSIHYGFVGAAFVAVAVMLFAFSTCLGWSHYGSKACEFLFGEKATLVYRAIYVAATFGGAVMGENLAWDIADTLNGMMMIPNLIGVLVLSPVVIAVTKNYVDRRLGHKDIEPLLSNFEDIQKEAARAVMAGER